VVEAGLHGDHPLPRMVGVFAKPRVTLVAIAHPAK